MTIIIRADASVGTGTGHVMRCLALAQAWKRQGGEAVFVQAETTPALVERLQADGFERTDLSVPAGGAADAARTLEAATRHDAAWIVADGYRFDTAWQQQIKGSGLGLLLIDDYGHAGRYHADFILNQNLSASDHWYGRRDDATQLLLGTRYALLRQEFLEWRDRRREPDDNVRRILVTLGGSDPGNVTGQVMEVLARWPDHEVVVVVGGSNPHLAALKRVAQATGKIRLVINAANMPELMAWADVAIAASGSTVWELAFMGVPSLLIVLAENQAAIGAALEREGISGLVGGPEDVGSGRLHERLVELLNQPARRAGMREKGCRLVDGLGASRVAQLLVQADRRSLLP